MRRLPFFCVEDRSLGMDYFDPFDMLPGDTPQDRSLCQMTEAHG
jgi:hypothetical protein